MLGRGVIAAFLVALLELSCPTGTQAQEVPAPMRSEEQRSQLPPAFPIDGGSIRHQLDSCPPQDRNETLLWGHPLLDPLPVPYGLFAAAQVDLVGPAIKQDVRGQVLLGGAQTEVTLPKADLNWTGASQIEVGHRLPEAVGELVATYRLLATSGRSHPLAFDDAGDADLRSRLDAHVVFLDYSSREFSLWPYVDMKAHVGICVPSIFFDNRASGANLREHVSSYYFGAGPHLGFDFWGRTPIPGLETYTRLQGVLTVGKVHQRFSESLLLPDGSSVSGDSSLLKVRESPMVNFELGLKYCPFGSEGRLSFATGYLFERWFYLAQTDDSRGELTVQGLFVRAEWGF